MIDRNQPPATVRIEKIRAMIPDRLVLDNGIPVYVIHSDIPEVCRIDMIFRAGTSYQQLPLTARFTNMLMTEGTRKHSAFELASLLEFYGAYLQPNLHKDYAHMSLSSLSSKLDKVLPLLEEVIMEAVFPEKEFSILLERERKSFIDDSRKVQSVAMREFNEQIFGVDSAYNHKARLEHFDAIDRESLVRFHASHYSGNGCMLLASGNLPKGSMESLNRLFGSKEWTKAANIAEPKVTFSDPAKKKTFIELPGSIQNALRLGKRTIKRDHPDFSGLQVLNTVLGGYFGSRLMTNIREDKGYTYGIYSYLIPYLHSGLFFIGTETASEVWKSALDEIYSEIKKMQDEKISEEELDLVISYLTGNRQRSLDCPLNTMLFVQQLLETGVDPVYYLQKELLTFQKISANELLVLAQKYLDPSEMIETICGKK
jgi:predicted Zn-dependent peptidase